jgi:hypothetical protein
MDATPQLFSCSKRAQRLKRIQTTKSSNLIGLKAKKICLKGFVMTYEIW